MSLFTDNIFDDVLIKPFNEGADHLLIISGYATANMVARHVEYLKKISKQILSIDLIVGMCAQDGLDIQNHEAFKDIQNRNEVKFTCQYIINRPPIHSKIYIWLKDSIPYKSFIGSANYTQNAFSKSMREVLGEINPQWSLDYYNTIFGETINCIDEENVKNYIELYNRKRIIKEVVNSIGEVVDNNLYEGLPKITLSLLDRNGNVPERSGLNWGQRPEYGRNPNQAYLSIPANIGRSGFFPERGEVFTITTDDDKQLICVRAQDNGKGLHSTLNNSLLGEYFRYRLGLHNGQEVKLEHLLKYGRTNVDLYKVDEEYYYMDFSV
ncbi:MAG TPA: restriction endonuclease PLD domain-containing protein [Candidatus Babeliaceae bacterium]|nr:restriction endonuclease PLD domain-containing protein [Candidatus Babeliaceae bacterium]